MPTIIKQSIPHIVIAMFVAPIMLSLFAWFGQEFLGNRDAKMQIPNLEKNINTILANQKDFADKQNSVLYSVWVNSRDIAVLKVKVGTSDDK
jgi:hypothetical protein